MFERCPRCNAPVFVKLDKREWRVPQYPIYECQSCSYNEERFQWVRKRKRQIFESLHAVVSVDWYSRCTWWLHYLELGNTRVYSETAEPEKVGHGMIWLIGVNRFNSKKSAGSVLCSWVFPNTFSAKNTPSIYWSALRNDKLLTASSILLRKAPNYYFNALTNVLWIPLVHFDLSWTNDVIRVYGLRTRSLFSFRESLMNSSIRNKGVWVVSLCRECR